MFEANIRISDLEDILERAGTDIGGDRIIEAKVALEKGDYSIADDIFAEIEAREKNGRSKRRLRCIWARRSRLSPSPPARRLHPLPTRSAPA